MADSPLRLGIIGCGSISTNYLGFARHYAILKPVACADLVPKRARALGDAFALRPVSVEALVEDADIDLVLNLTIPQAHAQVTLAAVEHGKHVWSEKPLAVTRQDGARIVAAARRQQVRVGCAPDTFLGSGQQVARKAIDRGDIGRPIAATAFLMSSGDRGSHPNVQMLFDVGGGPMFDFGPYYLTALINLLGPIHRVTGSAVITRPTRTLTDGDRAGQTIPVTTPDHVSGTIEFQSGAVATIVTSFAVWHSPHQLIHVFGTEGTLAVPDPNVFDGPVRLRGARDKDWRDLTPAHAAGHGRSAGAAEMAHALAGGRPHRAGLEQAFAVLDAMEGFLDSARDGKAHDVSAPHERPAPVPEGLGPYVFE